MLVSTYAIAVFRSRLVWVHILRAVFAFFICLSAPPLFATQTDIVGPPGSGAFGQSVTVLPNGNIVVVDTGYNLSGPTVTGVGAVHLYDGTTLALISTITGSSAGDQVGGNGITVLTNGNYIIRSVNWDNPSPLISNVGAVTWCSAVTGCSGVVSAANSLIGGTVNDSVGSGGAWALTNGNYVVSTINWDNPSPLTTNIGAVTWGNGSTGTSGLVTASNSLVGGTANDNIGVGVTPLTNGNYVVRSQNWDNPSPLTTDVGAVTWGNGTSGTVGLVTSSNSLIGSTVSDFIGNGGVTALTNGNYVVRSSAWDNLSPAIANAGAVTWGNGSTGTSGLVIATNSLVGGTASDQVGSSGVVALSNGNYVVRSQNWDNPSPLTTDVGAVTWGNGTSGTIGLVTSSNSLIGSTLLDQIGGNGVTALTNGNYVVSSINWDNPSPLTTNVGAVTWGNGSTGTTGLVTVSNSLIGGTANDQVGSSGVVALSNGNYVVASSVWDNPSPLISNVGAATWGNGLGGTVGLVTSLNSLVGGTAADFVGTGGVTAMTNGNYVVRSQSWNNPSPLVTGVGAVTWGNGNGGTVGLVTAANSVVGGTALDNVGSQGVTALTNGNYVVGSAGWDRPSPLSTDVGAVTWGNGAGGTVGLVTSANSLVGGTASDSVGGGVSALTNGNYIVRSSVWDNPSPTITQVGAVTWGNGNGGTVGLIASTNSLIGSVSGDVIGNNLGNALTNGNYVIQSSSWDNPSPVILDASAFTFGNGGAGTVGLITNGAIGGNSVIGTVANGTNSFAFDASRNRLFVGRSASNIVSVLSFTTTAIVSGDLNNAANWDNGLPNGLVTGVIPSGRAMAISTVMNAGQIHVQCGGSLTGGSASAYIVGSVRKDYCGAAGESFTYPIGDPNNYSPLNVTNTNGTGSLTASVSDDWLIGLQKTTSASRYWSLTGAGITADLAFTYTDGDVNGSESNYRASRRTAAGGINTPILSNPNPSTNTVTAVGISSFSDWGVGNNGSVAPTAAGVSVSGRIMISDGNGLRNAVVTMTGTDGVTRTARSSSFGYYSFDDVTAGETYVMEVVSKRYIFATRVVTVTDQLTDIDFVADGSVFSR